MIRYGILLWGFSSPPRGLVEAILVVLCDALLHFGMVQIYRCVMFACVGKSRRSRATRRHRRQGPSRKQCQKVKRAARSIASNESVV